MTTGIWLSATEELKLCGRCEEKSKGPAAQWCYDCESNRRTMDRLIGQNQKMEEQIDMLIKVLGNVAKGRQ